MLDQKRTLVISASKYHTLVSPSFCIFYSGLLRVWLPRSILVQFLYVKWPQRGSLGIGRYQVILSTLDNYALLCSSQLQAILVVEMHASLWQLIVFLANCNVWHIYPPAATHANSHSCSLSKLVPGISRLTIPFLGCEVATWHSWRRALKPMEVRKVTTCWPQNLILFLGTMDILYSLGPWMWHAHKMDSMAVLDPCQNKPLIIFR